MSWMSAIIGGGALKVVDSIFGSEEAEDARHASAQEAAISREWQERMSNTSYQRQIADLKAAGLNPMLGYMKGSGAVTPPGATGQSFQAPNNPIASNVAAMSSASQIAVNDATEKRIREETEKIAAERKEIEARTQTYPVTIDRMKQEIEESVARMQQITATVQHLGSSARHLEQQVVNLQAEIPRIGALVEQLRAQTKLTGAQTHLAKAQTHESGARTTQADAHTDEIRQRIAANLPALEAAYKELQNHLSKLRTPQAGMQAATHSSFLGAWNAALRALLAMESK